MALGLSHLVKKHGININLWVTRITGVCLSWAPSTKTSLSADPSLKLNFTIPVRRCLLSDPHQTNRMRSGFAARRFSTLLCLLITPEIGLFYTISGVCWSEAMPEHIGHGSGLMNVVCESNLTCFHIPQFFPIFFPSFLLTLLCNFVHCTLSSTQAIPVPSMP